VNRRNTELIYLAIAANEAFFVIVSVTWGRHGETSYFGEYHFVLFEYICCDE